MTTAWEREAARLAAQINTYARELKDRFGDDLVDVQKAPILGYHDLLINRLMEKPNPAKFSVIEQNKTATIPDVTKEGA